MSTVDPVAVGKTYYLSPYRMALNELKYTHFFLSKTLYYWRVIAFDDPDLKGQSVSIFLCWDPAVGIELHKTPEFGSTGTHGYQLTVTADMYLFNESWIEPNNPNPQQIVAISEGPRSIPGDMYMARLLYVDDPEIYDKKVNATGEKEKNALQRECKNCTPAALKKNPPVPVARV